MAFFGDFVITINEAELAAILADFYAASNEQRPNDFTPTNPSVVNTVNVAIAPPIPTAGDLQPTIEFAQAVVADSVAQFGKQETPLVVTLLETLDDAGDLAGYLLRPIPAFWFGNIQIVMNGLTDTQRTTIGNLDIGSQISVTKTFPNSTPSTVTQVMALEGISHDITPDRHIVTLYPNPARIYTYFIVGGYTTTTTRTNLVANPNLEVNTTGWASAQSSSVRSTDYAYSGTASYKVTMSSTTDSNVAYVTPTFSGTGNTTFSVYVYTPVGSTLAGRTISLSREGGTATQTAVSSSAATLVAGSWVRASLTRNITVAGTMVLVCRLSGTLSTAVGQLVYIDAGLAEFSSSALPYFDGTYADTYTGYTLTEQAWNGTADASTSTATWGLTSSFVGSELNDDTKGLG